jgi:hypothetical protein
VPGDFRADKRCGLYLRCWNDAGKMMLDEPGEPAAGLARCKSVQKSKNPFWRHRQELGLALTRAIASALVPLLDQPLGLRLGWPIKLASTDPLMRRSLMDAGIAPGMPLLEVGSAAGHGAFLLADIVGPMGDVVWSRRRWERSYCCA